MELRDLMDMDNPISRKENQTKDFVSQCTVPGGDIKLLEKKTNLYTEKSVTECEPPELIVCLKEDSYSEVKDICIDDGVPTLNKIPVENGEVNHEEPLSGQDVDSDLIKGVERAESILDVVEPVVECDAKMGVTSKCPSENLIEKGDFISRDGIVNDTCSGKMVVPENKLSAQELETENSQPQASCFNADGSPQQSDQDTSKEADPESSKVVPSTAEESNNDNAKEVSFNDNRDSSMTAASSRDEDPQNSEAKLLVQTVKTASPDNGSLESRIVSSRSLFTEHGYGDSSFSASDPPSSLVTYSGHIPYSGSVSLRSDSSTTSTRSFAFPILNSEWTSSPVKMAKADGRHYRKHQRWKLSILCCRF